MGAARIAAAGCGGSSAPFRVEHRRASIAGLASPAVCFAARRNRKRRPRGRMHCGDIDPARPDRLAEHELLAFADCGRRRTGRHDTRAAGIYGARSYRDAARDRSDRYPRILCSQWRLRLPVAGDRPRAVPDRSGALGVVAKPGVLRPRETQSDLHFGSARGEQSADLQSAGISLYVAVPLCRDRLAAGGAVSHSAGVRRPTPALAARIRSARPSPSARPHRAALCARGGNVSRCHAGRADRRGRPERAGVSRVRRAGARVLRSSRGDPLWRCSNARTRVMTQTFYELVIGGVMLAPFLTYALAAFAIILILRPILHLVGFARVFSHTSIAELSLYVAVLG